MYRRVILWMACLLQTAMLMSQNPLTSTVSASFKGEPLDQALLHISDQSSSQLAFNPDILPEKLITAEYDNAQLSHILDDLLGHNFQYKVRGSYVIIQPENLKETKSSVEVKGEVRDAETGERLANVSIYEVNKLTATLTSTDGSYNLSSKAYGERAVFAISKENYRDTIIAVDGSPDGFFNLFLEPLRKSKEKEEKPADKKNVIQFLLNEKIERHLKNVDLQEHRWAQLSLVPGIGTNGFLSGKVSNNLSLNIVGGYAHSLRGMELGGAFNLERMDVYGVQAAGALNMAGGVMKGVQLAGAVNNVLDSAAGVQIAGAVNATNGSFTGTQLSGAYNQSEDFQGIQMSGAINLAYGAFRGVQLSGAYNQTNDFHGFQMAGAFNLTKQFMGVQLAGAANVATSETTAVQVAGAYNQAQNFKGMQISGAMNYARNFNGFQMAGAYNHASEIMQGMQISGVINYAGTLKGVQFGVINIARNVEKGAMIGILNITKDGLLAVDFDYNDVTDYNLSFRSGPGHFYTLLTAGVSERKDLWSFGMGFGSQLSLYKGLFTELELTSHSLLPLDEETTGFPSDNRFNVSLGYNFTNRIAIHGGPVLHFLYFNSESETDLKLLNEIGQHSLYESTTDGTIHRLWIGYRVAVRI